MKLKNIIYAGCFIVFYIKKKLIPDFYSMSEAICCYLYSELKNDIIVLS